MKTLRLNLFLATFLTALSLFVVFVAYFMILGFNLIATLIFFLILFPIAANLSSSFFHSPKNLGVAIPGVLLFDAFMIFMTYKTDISIMILYSVLPALFLLLLYNYSQISFFRKK
ncbi:MAG TPA: hypothetical protein VFW11_05355 [Cyclobacteriaceae bacterium]|nr:hypothetical protein [Cyclobacteriaceae bacterium]